MNSREASLVKLRAALNALAQPREGDAAILQKLRANGGVPVEETPDEDVASFLSARGKPHKVRLHPEMAKHIPTLAHELGHAEVERKWWGPLVQNRVARALYSVSPFTTPLVAAVSQSVKNPWIRYGAAPLHFLASNAPVLLSEHAAWREGKKLLRAAGGTREHEEDMARSRLGSLPTYYLAPVLGAGASVGGALAGRRLFKTAGVKQRAARRIVDLYMKTASPEVVRRAFPALSAAFDSYSAVREQERQADLARQFSAYPGLMAQYSMTNTLPYAGGSSAYSAGASAPPVPHHRRHRHHSG